MMANPEHVEIVRKGRNAIARWKAANPDANLELSGVHLSDLDLRRADLTFADLRSAELDSVDLQEAVLHGADLTEAQLTKTTLVRADLSTASLASSMLSMTDLSCTHLSSASLCGANLSKSNLWEANLNEADLTGADLSLCDLSRADLTDAILDGAKLKQASLRFTNLNGASLRRTDFKQAEVGGSLFVNVDLSGAQNLESVKHRSRSIIDFETLARARDQLPETFLRGCGVPDVLIEHLPSLLGAMQPIQFYSCFISYSSKDDEFARRLHGRLEQEGLRVWFAPEDMKGGRRVVEQIDDAIRVHDRLLLVLSPNSMSSEWVRREIKRARRKEKQSGTSVLFPISLVPFGEIRDWECVDGDSGEDLAEKVREYHIPDFSCWKDHDQFEAAFAKLMEDLRKASDQDEAPGDHGPTNRPAPLPRDAQW